MCIRAHSIFNVIYLLEISADFQNFYIFVKLMMCASEPHLKFFDILKKIFFQIFSLKFLIDLIVKLADFSIFIQNVFAFDISKWLASTANFMFRARQLAVFSTICMGFRQKLYFVDVVCWQVASRFMVGKNTKIEITRFLEFRERNVWEVDMVWKNGYNFWLECPIWMILAPRWVRMKWWTWIFGQ